jgi:hypothetical protein
MKTAKDFLAAAHANSMPPQWCAARLAEIRAHVNSLDSGHVPQPYHAWLVELLSQLDANAIQATRAVQAVIDHYEPPAQVNVFPPACPRCTQRRDQCVCPPLFPEPDSTPF